MKTKKGTHENPIGYDCVPVAVELVSGAESLLTYTERDVRAKATGIYRNPRAGEWYIACDLLMAYKADCDLCRPFPIAKLVMTKTTTTIEEI